MTFSSQIYLPFKNNPPMILEAKLAWGGLGIGGFGALLMILNDKIGGYEWLDLLGKIVGISGAFLYLFGHAFGIAKNEPLNGKLTDSLKISPKFIQIGEKEFPIGQIKNFKIFFEDYEGKMYGKVQYIGPWCSNGVKNYISFEHDEKKIKEDFFIADKSQMALLKKIVTEIKNTVANNTYSK